MMLSGTAAYISINDAYDMLSGDILRIACSYSNGDWDKAQDYSSMAWERAVKFWHTFDGRNPKGWLGRILVNVVRAEYAKSKVSLSLDQICEDSQRVPTALIDPANCETNVESSETAADIRSVYCLLSSLDRESIELRMRQYSYKEAAELLGISMPAYQQRLHRARIRLKCLLSSRPEHCSSDEGVRR